jgi:uncharacterized protein YegP (UPF0339 family)
MNGAAEPVVPVPAAIRAIRSRRSTVAAKFELYKDGQSKYRFRLKAGNGEIIAVGEAYESKASAMSGIDSVRRNAVDATVDDQAG